MGEESIAAALAAHRTGDLPAFDLHWFTTTIRVRTGASRLSDYLLNQFDVDVPAYRETVGVRPAREVHAIGDARLLDRIRTLTADSEPMPRQSFKTQTYLGTRTLDGEFVLVPAEAADHALVTDDHRSWYVVGAEDGPSGLSVTRVIREIIREELLDQGALMFHGAAGRTPDGRGIFLAGESGAGKTSAALRIAQSGGRVVGTDRTLLLRRADGWWIVGLPTSTRLGVGAAKAFDILEPLREAAPIRAINPFNPLLPEQTYENMSEKKVSLSNGEVRDLLAVRFLAATAADHLVVLDRRPDGEFRTEAMDAARASQALAAHLLDPDPDYPDLWLQAEATAVRSTDPAARLAELVADVPTSHVGWYPPDHCNDRTVERLTAAALAT